MGDINSQMVTNHKDEYIENYVGEYEFYEFLPPNFNMMYDIVVYRQNDGYYANFLMNGHTTFVDVIAKVVKSPEGISLIMYKNNENSMKVFEEGEELLALSKNDDSVYTYWKGVEPMKKENLNNKYCFETQGDGSLVLTN